MEYICDVCSETFPVEVWHCPICDHHWPIEEEECGNCHRIYSPDTNSYWPICFPQLHFEQLPAAARLGLCPPQEASVKSGVSFTTRGTRLCLSDYVKHLQLDQVPIVASESTRTLH